MAMFSCTENEGELWVSCCKRFIGIVQRRKTGSTRGGHLSNQSSLQSKRQGSRRCGFHPQTKQLDGNRWDTIPTTTMTSANSIKKAACLPGSVPKPNYSTLFSLLTRSGS